MKKREERLSQNEPVDKSVGTDRVQAAYERMREIEDEMDVWSHTLDGWLVWVFLRPLVFSELLFPLPSQRRYRQIDRLMHALRDLPGLIAPKKAQLFVQAISSHRAEIEDGLYRNIVIDDFLIEQGNCFLFEVADRQFHRRSRSPLVKVDLSDHALSVLAAFGNRFFRPRKALLLADELARRFQEFDETRGFSREKIAVLLVDFLWRKRLFSWLLRRVEPEVVLLTTTYNYAIVAAARELGIQTVEIQHGMPTRNKISYSWSASAAPYKSRMPIPQWLFLTGEHFIEELKVNGFWDEELRAVGSFKIERYRERAERKRGENRGGCCSIVATTQGIDVDRWILFISEFLELAKNRVEVHLTIKLHPRYEPTKQAYLAAFGGDDRVRVVLGNEPPSTYDLIADADLHLTVYSTTHCDSLGIGVPTVILPLERFEMAMHLHQAGHALFAQSPLDLLEIVMKSGSEVVPESVGSWYFKKGAMENFTKELQKVLENATSANPVDS